MPRRYTIAEENGNYLRFAVTDNETGRTVLEFATNKNREGMFTRRGNVWEQLKGTSQFDMPLDRRACCDKLRKMARGIYSTDNL